MRNYTQKEQFTLDAMISVGSIERGMKPRNVFLLTHSVAEVMRQHCDWTITAAEADDVAKEVTHRFGI